jgi:hypothetical protein
MGCCFDGPRTTPWRLLIRSWAEGHEAKGTKNSNNDVVFLRVLRAFDAFVVRGRTNHDENTGDRGALASVFSVSRGKRRGATMNATKVALLGVPYDASSSFLRGAAGAPA